MSAEMLMIVFFLKRRGRDLTFCSMVTVHTSCTALVILSAAKDLLPSAAALCKRSFAYAQDDTPIAAKTGDFVRKCEQ